MTTQADRTVIDGKALDLLSLIGKEVGTIILQEAAGLASRDETPGGRITVTIEHVRASVAGCLAEPMRSRIGVLADAGR